MVLAVRVVHLEVDQFRSPVAAVRPERALGRGQVPSRAEVAAVPAGPSDLRERTAAAAVKVLLSTDPVAALGVGLRVRTIAPGRTVVGQPLDVGAHDAILEPNETR